MGHASSAPLGTTGMTPEQRIIIQGSVAFLSYGEGAAAPQIFRDAFLPDDKTFWQLQCERLARGRSLTALPPERWSELGVEDWQEYFARLWANRHGVIATPPLEGGPGWARDERSTMRGVVRVRPAGAVAIQAGDSAGEQARRVTVPLHQRVALVRQRNPGLSAKEARVKAMAAQQTSQALRASILGHSEVAVHALAPYVGAKSFEFDEVLTRRGYFADESRRRGGRATWTLRGDESRRRRGCDVDISWRQGVETPRLRRGYSVETNRGDAAAATRIFRGDESRRRRGCRRWIVRGDESHAAGTRRYIGGRTRGAASGTSSPRCTNGSSRSSRSGRIARSR